MHNLNLMNFIILKHNHKIIKNSYIYNYHNRNFHFYIDIKIKRKKDTI